MITKSAILTAEKMLIQMINDHQELRSMITGVFVYLPENTKMPYIHISKITTKEWGTKTFTSLAIKIELSCYSDEKGNKELSIIQAILTEMFHNKHHTFEDYHFIISTCKSSEITHSKKGGNYVLITDINLKIY